MGGSKVKGSSRMEKPPERAGCSHRGAKAANPQFALCNMCAIQGVFRQKAWILCEGAECWVCVW